MAHYDTCYGDNDMNPPSLLTMRNVVGISVMNACRGALKYFNSITKTYQSGSLRKAVYND
jgi:hypothetical protein